MVPSPPEVGRWQGCKTGTFRRQVQRRCGSGERTPRSAANSRAALPGQPPQRQRRWPANTVRARTANTRSEQAKTGAATPATGLRRLSRVSFLGEKVAETRCSCCRGAAFTPCAGEAEESAGQAARAAPDASPCADRETSFVVTARG